MPPDYVFYAWRKLMGVSYTSMLNTPVSVIMRDLEFNSIERGVENAKRQQASK